MLELFRAKAVLPIRARCRRPAISQEDDPIKPFADPIKPFFDPIYLFADPINWREEKEGAIIRVGSNKTGHWEINKEKTYG